MCHNETYQTIHFVQEKRAYVVRHHGVNILEHENTWGLLPCVLEDLTYSSLPYFILASVLDIER